MGEALLFGLIASSALVPGAALGTVGRPPDVVVGVLLAFASGSLISALASELFAARRDARPGAARRAR